MRWIWTFSAVLTLAPCASWANGRPAATTSIAFTTNPQRIITGATFGALVSDDGGTMWRLICEDPLGTKGVVADPVFRDSPTGVLLVGSTMGLLYSRDGGCSYTGGSGSIVMQAVQDLAINPTNPMRVLAATNTVGAANGVHISDDGGTTWMAPALIANTEFRGVVFADGQRAYALAIANMTGTLLVYRSDDGGSTFNAVGTPAQGLVGPRLIGVSPLDRNTFFFSVVTANNDALYRSTDGGQTLQLIVDAIPAIYGGTIAADGSVYVATSSGVRKLPAGSTTLGAAPAGSPPITCVGLHAGALYGCSTEEATGFALGRSTDEGQTWTPVLRFSQDIIGPLQCAGSTDVCLECYPMWSTFAAQFNIRNLMNPMCTSDNGDGGTPPPDAGHSANGASPGCGCSVGAAGSTGSILILLLALLIVRRR
jgi:MYXO-CTERM domain-containing protein